MVSLALKRKNHFSFVVAARLLELRDSLEPAFIHCYGFALYTEKGFFFRWLRLQYNEPQLTVKTTIHFNSMIEFLFL